MVEESTAYLLSSVMPLSVIGLHYDLLQLDSADFEMYQSYNPGTTVDF
jgi:hypothetical protein